LTYRPKRERAKGEKLARPQKEISKEDGRFGIGWAIREMQKRRKRAGNNKSRHESNLQVRDDPSKEGGKNQRKSAEEYVRSLAEMTWTTERAAKRKKYHTTPQSANLGA